MHDIEPHYNWRNLYTADQDELSPFYGREYSEFEFTNRIYNYLIHPQWDDFGSTTMFVKILFCDYQTGFAIIEMIGEWNDLLYNDIMLLKRNIIEQLVENGVNQFILIGENILNFHPSDDCYYEEWFDEIEDGWICLMNFRPHVLEEFVEGGIDSYVIWGEEMDQINWRTHQPLLLYQKIESMIPKLLN